MNNTLNAVRVIELKVIRPSRTHALTHSYERHAKSLDCNHIALFDQRPSPSELFPPLSLSDGFSPIQSPQGNYEGKLPLITVYSG